MVNIYSIKEILEASNNILKSSKENKTILSLNNTVLENKKETNILINNKLPIKNIDNKKNTPIDLDKIILEAENTQLNTNKMIDDQIETKEQIETKDNLNLFKENTINQKNLIDDLYKTFGKKIKKNTLQLILNLRRDVIILTKDISHLKQNKKELETKNIKLSQNIDNLKDEEGSLKNNLNQSISGFNKLNYENKKLKLNYNNLEKNLLDNNKKLNESNEINIQLNNNLNRSKQNFNTLYDNNKVLKLNFNTLEEDLDYKKKILNISEEFNKKLENKIKNLDDKLIEYKDIELNLFTKVEKLENYIFTYKTKQDELINKNNNLEKDNKELKTKLDSIGHIDIYIDEINQLKLKNKDLENIIEKLKSYEDNNDQNLNIIKELENKIKYYQEENIRISNQLYEVNKRFDIIKSEIEVLQDQRSSLIAKINSVNDVIGNSKIITNVFNSPESIKNEVKIVNPQKKIERQKININEEILDIFRNK